MLTMLYIHILWNPIKVFWSLSMHLAYLEVMIIMLLQMQKELFGFEK